MFLLRGESLLGSVHQRLFQVLVLRSEVFLLRRERLWGHCLNLDFLDWKDLLEALLLSALVLGLFRVQFVFLQFCYCCFYF